MSTQNTARRPLTRTAQDNLMSRGGAIPSLTRGTNSYSPRPPLRRTNTRPLRSGRG